MQALGPDGMSSDESDTEGAISSSSTSQPRRGNNGGPSALPAYRVLSPRWRSDELTNFLHLLDNLHISLRRMDPTRQRGSWPRVRYYDPTNKKVSNSKRFVTHLPLNAYDSKFLETFGNVRGILKPTEALSFVPSCNLWRYGW
jgi:hypothetical protein